MERIFVIGYECTILDINSRKCGNDFKEKPKHTQHELEIKVGEDSEIFMNGGTPEIFKDVPQEELDRWRKLTNKIQKEIKHCVKNI